MIHYNKQSKYKYLYSMLENLSLACSLKSLYFQHGSAVGWTCAHYIVQFSNEELVRFDNLVKEIVRIKEKELIANKWTN